MTEMNTEQVKLEALHQAYLDACNKRDYQTCDKLRQEIDALLKGKSNSGFIPCENELRLDPNDILSMFE